MGGIGRLFSVGRDWMIKLQEGRVTANDINNEMMALKVKC